jgi:enoyl-CoA hydratase/carnithine racemase
MADFSRPEGEEGQKPLDFSQEIFIDVGVGYRDPGGQVASAIYNCRKATIAAVNGHAVCKETTLIPILDL